MVNFEINSVSAINTLSASYYDPFYRFKQYKENYEQGFAFNKINALNNIVDSSINNYTVQYLTSKTNIGNMFVLDTKEEPIRTLTTQLVFNSLYGSSPRYLYFYNNTVNKNPKVTACRAVLSSAISIVNNSFFELEILDDLFLRVKHNTGRSDYYLNYLPEENSVAFLNYYSDVSIISAEQNDMFRYVLDTDGFLQLYKNTSTGNKVLSLSSTSFSEGKTILSFTPITSAGLVAGIDNVIKVNYSIKELAPKEYSSWISYDIKKQNDLTINQEKSVFDRSDQYLLHANINESKDALNLNYITLNNIRSEKNYIKRGTNMINAPQGLPGVEFREYMSLQTGNSQELGNDNIALTYVWYDKDVKIRNGFDTVFTAPSTLYPYTKININDTKFADNGSLAGLTPRLADNIYQLRKNTSGFNNGRYLVTWLSGGTLNKGIWVDRYYYPDYISKRAALSSQSVFSPSYIDPIDSMTFARDHNVAAEAFFDKKSDLCIEPNCTYKYVRVGSQDINEFVSATLPTVSGFTEFYDFNNNIQQYSSNSITYDGTRYNVFEVAKSINDSNSFTVSFDLYVDPEGSYGYQIFGNITNKGFGVVSDTKITPFINSYSGRVLKVYNTDLVLLYTTVFDTDILDIIKGEGLDDYYVVCNGGRVYKVNTLGVKVKMEVIPEIVGYINYFFDGSYVYFVNSNTENDVIKIDKNTLEVVDTLTSTPYESSYEKDNNLYNIKNSILVYDGIVRNLPTYEVKYYTPDIVYYILGSGGLAKHDLKKDEVTFVIKSDSTIIDIAVDDKNIYIIHNTNKISVYTHGLDLVTSLNLLDIIPNLKGLASVDIINQYVGVISSNKLNRDIVIVYIDNNDNIGLYIPSNDLNINTELKGFVPDRADGSRLKTGYVATNFSYLNQTKNTNSLGFNLTLTNYLSTEDILQKNITFDYSTLDKGYHTFTYRFDPIQGNITLFVDGVLYENLTVQPGKYAIQDVLNDNFYAGTAGFYNNTDLATYLKQPGYYYLTDTQLKNVFIYNRPLSDDEILALNIYDTPINDLVLSIPAGQRNNIEEIIQYFKFRVKDSSAKKVNVYVKNAGITNADMQANIKNLILQESASILPIGVNINDIQFIDYK